MSHYEIEPRDWSVLFENQPKPNEINQYDFMCLLILANQIEDDLGLEVSNVLLVRFGRTHISDLWSRSFRVVVRAWDSGPESVRKNKILLQHEIYTIMNEGSKDVEKQFRKIEQPGIQRHFWTTEVPEFWVVL